MSACSHGIVLHRRQGVGSAHYLDVLTEQDGRQRYAAPAASASRRRFGGGCDVYAKLRLFVHPKARPGGLPTLTHVESIDARLGLRDSLGGLTMAAVLCQATRRLLPEAMAMPAVYHDLDAALSLAAQQRWPQASIFLLRLAAHLGMPISPRCTLCQRQAASFEGPPTLGLAAAGVLVCAPCRPQQAPLPTALRRALLGQPPEEAAEAIALVQVARAWLQHHADLPAGALATSMWPPP